MSNKRCYVIEDVDWPRVSTVLGLLDKPFMAPYAVQEMAKYADDKYLSYISSGKKRMSAVDHHILMLNAAKNYKTISAKDCGIGSEVHGMIEIYIKAILAGEDQIPQRASCGEAERTFSAFLKWSQENIANYIASELTVHCPVHGYAGTLDLVARLKNGKIYVIDFKSSKGFYSGYDLQIAAYRAAYTKDVDGMGILRLDKTTGLPEWKDYSDVYGQKLEAFRALCKFYYLDKKRKLKNNPFILQK